MSRDYVLKHTYSIHDLLMKELANPDDAAIYLQVYLEEYQKDNNADLLLLGLRHVAEAQGGLAKLAKKTRLNRQSLYKILSKAGNPRLDTFGLILKGLGFHLSIQKNKKPVRKKVKKSA